MRSIFYSTEILSNKKPVFYPEDGQMPCYHFFSSFSHEKNLSKYLAQTKYSSAVTGGPCRSLTSQEIPSLSARCAAPKPCSAVRQISSRSRALKPEGFLCKMTGKAYSLLLCVCFMHNVSLKLKTNTGRTGCQEGPFSVPPHTAARIHRLYPAVLHAYLPRQSRPPSAQESALHSEWCLIGVR